MKLAPHCWPVWKSVWIVNHWCFVTIRWSFVIKCCHSGAHAWPTYKQINFPRDNSHWSINHRIDCDYDVTLFKLRKINRSIPLKHSNFPLNWSRHGTRFPSARWQVEEAGVALVVQYLPPENIFFWHRFSYSVVDSSCWCFLHTHTHTNDSGHPLHPHKYLNYSNIEWERAWIVCIWICTILWST